MDRVINKINTIPDVTVGVVTSAGLVSTPVWVGPLTDVLQAVTLVVGIVVGISVYRLNTARRKALGGGDE